MRHIFSFTMPFVFCLLLAVPAMAQSQTTTAPKIVKPITTVAPKPIVAPTTTTRATATKTEAPTKTKTKEELIEDKKAGLGWERGKKPGVHKEEQAPELTHAAAGVAKKEKAAAAHAAKKAKAQEAKDEKTKAAKAEAQEAKQAQAAKAKKAMLNAAKCNAKAKHLKILLSLKHKGKEAQEAAAAAMADYTANCENG